MKSNDNAKTFQAKELEKEDIDSSIIKKNIDQIKEKYKSLPNRLLKSNFRGQTYSIAKTLKKIKKIKKINTLKQLIRWYTLIKE